MSVNTSNTPSAATPVERSAFLKAMRAVANSVTVVTTQNETSRHGGTVSAFCSVSADPPTVLVCLNRDSRIAQQVKENGSFCVNVLPHTHQFVSDRFAGRHDQQVSDRFDGIELVNPDKGCSDGGFAAPVIAGSTAFCCQVLNTMDSGSHYIVVGQVQGVQPGVPEPLIYFDGEYHRLYAPAQKKRAEVASLPAQEQKSDPQNGQKNKLRSVNTALRKAS